MAFAVAALVSTSTYLSLQVMTFPATVNKIDKYEEHESVPWGTCKQNNSLTWYGRLYCTIWFTTSRVMLFTRLSINRWQDPHKKRYTVPAMTLHSGWEHLQ